MSLQFERLEMPSAFSCHWVDTATVRRDKDLPLELILCFLVSLCLQFGIEDLKKEENQTACWDGVRNYQVSFSSTHSVQIHSVFQACSFFKRETNAFCSL